MPQLKDLTGKNFGYWKVLYRNGSTENKAAVWRCLCTLCGNEYDVVGQSLFTGRSTKCWKCVYQHHERKPYNGSKIHVLFMGMKQRCYYQRHVKYKDYGGRGIKICQEWLDKPDAFYEWAFAHGYEEGMSIDRIDNNKDYTPDNCRFIPRSEQQKNRRSNVYITHNSETHCVAEWCRILGIKANTVRSRHDRGYSWEQAIWWDE